MKLAGRLSVSDFEKVIGEYTLVNTDTRRMTYSMVLLNWYKITKRVPASRNFANKLFGHKYFRSADAMK